MKSTTIASCVRFRAKRASRAILFVALGLTGSPAFGAGPAAFLPLPPETNSTVPANGDVDPFGIAFVPSNYSGGGVLEAGDILVYNFNGDVSFADPSQPSEIVEFTVQGSFVRQLSVDPNPGGLFGIAVATTGNVARLAAVNDNRDTLTIWTLPSH